MKEGRKESINQSIHTSVRVMLLVWFCVIGRCHAHVFFWLLTHAHTLERSRRRVLAMRIRLCGCTEKIVLCFKPHVKSSIFKFVRLEKRVSLIALHAIGFKNTLFSGISYFECTPLIHSLVRYDIYIRMMRTLRYE